VTTTDSAIATALTAWFEGAARDLPWRRTKDPYAIWVSEVMLQQTRVDTVKPYYARFLERFPTVAKLAEAELDHVLEAWSGLGYYRRARVLYAAAREVTTRYGGAVPGTAKGLLELPGVGAYTAGAIASIAYGERVPLVDGNVARVLSRLFAIDHVLGTSASNKALWSTAERLVPAANPGIFNQSLMELGATVCTPREPSCASCPVAKWCRARAEGRTNELPIVAPKKEVPSFQLVALVLARGPLVLFGRRAGDGLFGGMWEPPTVEARSIAAALPMLVELGAPVGDATPHASGEIRHVLSHKKLRVKVARAVHAGREPKVTLGAPYDAAAWLDPRDAGVGLSTLCSKILRSTPAKAKASKK
jgi:A/G-specific adenine glycosylase